MAGHLFGRERTDSPRCADRSGTPTVRTASIAARICRPTIRSITCCRGRRSASTARPTWCWRARAATATRAVRDRRCRSWTECSIVTEMCWNRSHPRSSGQRSAIVWWPRRSASTGCSRRCADVVGVPAERAAGYRLCVVVEVNCGVPRCRPASLPCVRPVATYVPWRGAHMQAGRIRIARCDKSATTYWTDSQ